MQLSDEHIEQFRELYRKNFHKEISKEVALDKAMRLIRLVKTVLTEDARITAEENELKLQAK